MTDKPKRPSKSAPAAPSFTEMEENVRQRLITNGQSGALAEFGKYTAAVHERLSKAVDGALQSVSNDLAAKRYASEPEAAGPAIAAKPKAAAKPRAKKASSK